MGRVIGLDISKHSAEVAMLEPGSPTCKRRRLSASAAGIRAFAGKLGPDDSVALESCTNAFAFHRLLAADFLPPVWVPDPFTDQLRHWVNHRQGLVTQRTQAKNRIHACTATSSPQTSPISSARLAGLSWPMSRCQAPNNTCSKPT